MQIVTIEKEAWLTLKRKILDLEYRYNLLQEQVVSDRLYTREEVSKILNISESTLQNYRINGHIGFIKIGKSIRFRWDDISVFLNKRQSHGSPEV